MIEVIIKIVICNTLSENTVNYSEVQAVGHALSLEHSPNIIFATESAVEWFDVHIL